MTERKEKNKQKFKERGITLIALVITIIVLLILAGVALSALIGDSGILNNAESAKEKTNLSNAKEQVALAANGALTKGYNQGVETITRDNLKNELDNIVGEINKDYTLSEGESPWTVKVGKYETLVYATGKIEQNENPGGAGNLRDTTTLPSKTGTTPWLPAGFSQVKDTTLDTGLTITKTNGDLKQNYVWIEVPTTISADINGTTVTLANAQSESEILEILEVYAGKGTETNYRNSNYKDEWYDGCGMTESEYQTAYRSMLNSIKTYGGFWLAQYEAGIEPEKEGEQPTNRAYSAPRITNPTSANYARDQYPYINVYCSEAQKIANADTTSSYISSLPFGIQWDLVCKFLEVKTNLTYADIATKSDWGNTGKTSWTSSDTSKYSDDNAETFKSGPKTKTASDDDYCLTTGALEKTTSSDDESPMNIYDFAGNIMEWTLEYSTEFPTEQRPCTSRGTHYSAGSPLYDVFAAERASDSTKFYMHTGFRSTLY